MHKIVCTLCPDGHIKAQAFITTGHIPLNILQKISTDMKLHLHPSDAREYDFIARGDGLSEFSIRMNPHLPDVAYQISRFWLALCRISNPTIDVSGLTSRH